MKTHESEAALVGATAPLWSAAVAEEMRDHRGRWVALEEGRIVAVADSLDEVIEAATDAGCPEPLAFRVPANPDKATVYAAHPKGS